MYIFGITNLRTITTASQSDTVRTPGAGRILSGTGGSQVFVKLHVLKHSEILFELTFTV